MPSGFHGQQGAVFRQCRAGNAVQARDDAPAATDAGTDESNGGGGLSTGAMIGIAAAAACVMLAVAAALLAVRYFKRRRRSPPGHDADLVRYSYQALLAILGCNC